MWLYRVINNDAIHFFRLSDLCVIFYESVEILLIDFITNEKHTWKGAVMWWIRQSRYKTKKWFQKLDKETEIMSDQR